MTIPASLHFQDTGAMSLLDSVPIIGGDPNIAPQQSKRQPRLPPLRIREQAPRGRRSLLVEVNNLIEGTAAKLARLGQEIEGQSIGSSRTSSSDSFDLSNKDISEGAASEVGDEEKDIEVEKGLEVNQVEDQVPSITAPAMSMLDSVLTELRRRLSPYLA
ncbi:hypothetical protein Acr_00g0037800 [Actinidia rufa]|uniref:Uncharacterized protein n=1 Tax=Actinidia rufa TaxID=165716 RepID=A0A7J0DH52_9ERIC|nr:hypothetical protein Acr_00g0037800 [Actinidia rufa]